MKPPVPYFGGKQSTAQAIVALFPPHEMYVEPYAGGLSVLLEKTPSPIEIVNDLDGDLVNFWRVLRDSPRELWERCEATPHSRVEFEDASDFGGNDIERARKVWVRLTQGRSGQLRPTGWRYNTNPATAPGVSMAGYLNAYRSRLLPAAQRLQNVSIENRPALDVIRQHGHSGALLYVDPPYLGSTRASSGYRHDMLAAEEHSEMLEALLATDAAVVLSGYASPLYDEALTGWSRYEISAHTQESAKRTEVVWVNREDDAALFSMAGHTSIHIRPGKDEA